MLPAARTRGLLIDKIDKSEIEARLDLGAVNVDQVNNLVNEFDLRRNGDEQELSTDQSQATRGACGRGTWLA